MIVATRSHVSRHGLSAHPRLLRLRECAWVLWAQLISVSGDD
jgi:hypothetical protein